MKGPLTLEILLSLIAGFIIALVAWAIYQRISEYKRFVKGLEKEAKRREEEARQELLSKPRRWAREEVIIASHLALYGAMEQEDVGFIEELGSRMKRTPGSINRKIKRIIYLDTDDGSKLGREVVDLLVGKGKRGSAITFQEAIARVTGSTQWLDKYILIW